MAHFHHPLDPERIWLTGLCRQNPSCPRLWVEDPEITCPDCRMPPTEYIRADLGRETPTLPDSATYPRPAHGWTCFHCGETFRVPGLAADHFGADPTAQPACQIKAGHERHLVAAIRDAEAQLARYRSEDSDTDRAMARMKSEHSAELQRAEEKGYAAGLSDGRSVNPMMARDRDEPDRDAVPR